MTWPSSSRRRPKPCRSHNDTWDNAERYGNGDNARIIDETRQYIRDFDRLDKETTTAEELYRQMLAIHPHRVNPGALWLSVQSVKA